MTFELSLSTSTIVEDVVRRLGQRPRMPASTPRPVHVVYGGAHLFRAATPAKLGDLARSAMESWGSDDLAFGKAVGVEDPELARIVAARVRAKLARAPLEAMCIDFEDGYGLRADEEEDAEAVRAAKELAATPPGPSIGIRIKALSGTTTRRAIRTLDLFVTALARATNGALRPGFTVTLPKVTTTAEVDALVSLLEALESSLGAPRIGVELMIETPRALFDERGGVALPSLVEAARGRAEVVHLGAYDLTAELGVTAGDQRLDHPYCDLARMVMQLSVSHVVAVADGATTLMPIPPKGAPAEEGAAAVHTAWKAHARNVRRAAEVGIWQGWDLHPAQLPARYGALFAYFLERRAALAERLRTFVERATQATRIGQVFDDAATGQGLLNFFLRGMACGALDEDDLRTTTLTMPELESRSFEHIVATRSGSAVKNA